MGSVLRDDKYFSASFTLVLYRFYIFSHNSVWYVRDYAKLYHNFSWSGRSLRLH